MIPSVLSSQLRRSVEDFLRTTFPISTPLFQNLIESIFDVGDGIFRGPYISVELPLRDGDSSSADYFPDVPLAFTPYLHQEIAFRRLGGINPRSTIVATGTGSGKTESFLQPILDHCRRTRGQRGIKALIIYPMNALASNQAERIAKAIWQNSNLKNYVTAGLFVGGEDKHKYMQMGEGHVITDKEMLRKSPPDILLTNYKMLDYLLIRPRDLPLWSENSAETLRYLVVDEIHTFDGAQGSDLACLIRRLKSRLGTPSGHLCCVGTSATLGGESGRTDLLKYASELFGETFDDSAIVVESRKHAGEFFERSLITHTGVVKESEADALRPESYPDRIAYIIGQYRLWFGSDATEADIESTLWRAELGKKLKGHAFFRNLLTVLGGRALSYDNVLQQLADDNLLQGGASYRRNILDSMVALIATAREGVGIRPFLNVRVQFWMRELTRMVAPVVERPSLRFADDLRDTDRETHLPVVHCRDCGSCGWAGVLKPSASRIDPDLQRFYTAFFGRDHHVVFLFPDTDTETELHAGMAGVGRNLCSECLELFERQSTHCPACGSAQPIRVFVPDSTTSEDGQILGDHTCPYCVSAGGLTVMGSRAASLTSVMITQLFASTFNDDKKLLAFSDSVQDAAHRAGFFAARTYRFNLRSALQRFVKSAADGLTLAEIPHRFFEYWRAELGLEKYVATFIAPDMTWLDGYQDLRETGVIPPIAKLADYVDKRVSWEITSEYGFNARIGRTLEKSGSSVVYIDPDLLEASVELLYEPLCNEIGELRDLDRDMLRQFLAGVLVHLKNNGGISHPDLIAYIKDLGNAFLIGRQQHMPGFGKSSRAPVFITSYSGASRFDTIPTQKASRHTWSEHWAIKIFAPLNVPFDYRLRDLYLMALAAMVKSGVLDRYEVKNENGVWGIRPEALRVSTEVLALRCEKCGHSIAIAPQESATWQAAPCLRFRCSGRYDVGDSGGDNYYARLYQTGDIVRIVAEEHTGLLKRDVREALESSFMRHDQRAWDPNVLSSTSTLEMGIDIGDLSTVVLCSIPPTKANYVQRIGRAGRRDGNALIIAVANGRPHDLYFFAEPEQMIAGNVDTPSMFLNAPAVLARQFTAFCFDRWVESGLPANAIPYKLGPVLDALQPVKADRFPHNFLRFIEHNQTDLFDHFVGLLHGTVSEESTLSLHRFVYGEGEDEGSLRYKIVESLHRLHVEQELLKKKVQLIHKRIKKKADDPAKGKNHEGDVNNLQMEKSALGELVKAIRDRDTYNFFTDQGLIPNYAFPEAGVQLRSVIYRPHKNPNRRRASQVYEYERPARNAIHELAPANTFFAEGRKVVIDQINIELSKPEVWRFCDRCTYMQQSAVASDDNLKCCPRCGSTLFSNVGQKQQMVPMRQVIATTPDRKSRIVDDSEDRDPAFYNRRMMVDVDEADITDAWRVQDESLPFGFEFLSRATFREINLGLKKSAGEKIMIAGDETVRTGFVVCGQCGKVKVRGKSIDHAFWCTAHGNESSANSEGHLFLYREFASEAIRILLPVGTFSGSDEKLHSFIAALQLGLKKRFGSVDHLETAVHEEPVSGLNIRKRFLVLYDTVPGGTGYLKQLMDDSEPMMKVFERALETISACDCGKNPDKDGCYRCLFAYRNSRDMPVISRSQATDLLRDLLDHRTRMVRVDTLKDVKVTSLEESELENLFVEALRRSRINGLPVTVRKETVNGKPGRFVQIADQSYYLEPQVDLGPSEGVSIKSRADFVFRPARQSKEHLPVVIFTDGFQFHRDRVGRDMAQRMAIVRSGRFLVWSLTWNDVLNRFKKIDRYYNRPIPKSAEEIVPILSQFESIDGVMQLHDASQQDSFELLIRYLAKPQLDAWRYHGYALGLIPIFKNRLPSSDLLLQRLQYNGVELPAADIFSEERSLMGITEGGDGTEGNGVIIASSIDPAMVNSMDIEQLHVFGLLRDSQALRESDGFVSKWNGFLQLFNLLQFLPNAFFVSSDGMQSGEYDSLASSVSVASARVPSDTPIGGWEELREWTSTEIHGLLEYLQSNNLPLPIAGYELQREDGVIIAEAELGWPKAKVALLRDDQSDYAETFSSVGWHHFHLAHIIGDSQSLRESLAKLLIQVVE